MQYRKLGRTGLQVSVLGFGCGAVGGLLIKGDHQSMLEAVNRALELGINYFDTAALYGDGVSESNLGRVLAEVKADTKTDLVVGSKVRLGGTDLHKLETAVIASVEASLRRLQREPLDLIQLHSPLTMQSQPIRDWLTLDTLAQVVSAFRTLQAQGKVRFWGITGLGETEALHQAVAQGEADTIQCCYNLLNPTAGFPAPAGFPFQDYGQLIDRAAEQQMGVIAIRVLAGGALSGSAARHPHAMQTVAPIASGRNFGEDVARAGAFHFLVDAGYVESLVEAALRFAISKPTVSTALIGFSDRQQLEEATIYANLGPLASEILDQLLSVWEAA